MFRAAAQGDTKAGRQLLEVIARAESGRTGTAVEMLQFAHQYKEKNGPIFEQREREGLDPPDVFPHPDDVIIDGTTGEVTIEKDASDIEIGFRCSIRFRSLLSDNFYPVNFLKEFSEKPLRHSGFSDVKTASKA